LSFHFPEILFALFFLKSFQCAIVGLFVFVSSAYHIGILIRFYSIKLQFLTRVRVRSWLQRTILIEQFRPFLTPVLCPNG